MGKASHPGGTSHLLPRRRTTHPPNRLLAKMGVFSSWRLAFGLGMSIINMKSKPTSTQLPGPCCPLGQVFVLQQGRQGRCCGRDFLSSLFKYAACQSRRFEVHYNYKIYPCYIITVVFYSRLSWDSPCNMQPTKLVQDHFITR